MLLKASSFAKLQFSLQQDCQITAVRPSLSMKACVCLFPFMSLLQRFVVLAPEDVGRQNKAASRLLWLQSTKQRRSLPSRFHRPDSKYLIEKRCGVDFLVVLDVGDDGAVMK